MLVRAWSGNMNTNSHCTLDLSSEGAAKESILDTGLDVRETRGGVGQGDGGVAGVPVHGDTRVRRPSGDKWI